MRFRALLLACLLPMLAAAGCLGSSTELAPAAAAPEPEAQLRDLTTTSVPVSLVFATPVGEPADSAQGEVVVSGENATLLVEAQWTCASPTCAFQLILIKDGEWIAGEPGEGAASLVKGVAPGTYGVALVSRGPAAQMQGEIRATEFDGAVVDGFTAF
jgi:hypothetical protein